MLNLSKITLQEKRREIIKVRTDTIGSKDMLSDPTSEYAEHHRHVINVYNEVLAVLDAGIIDSADIGKGV